MADDGQLVLISGLYRCHNCGLDVDRVQKSRRFRLCDECWAQIVEPTMPGDVGPLAMTDELWQAREQYWQWYEHMEQRYPSKRSWHNATTPALALSVDSYYPYCACGEHRRVINIGRPGLFGGPYTQLCPTCEAKRVVESLFKMAPRLMPGRDEEEWLDVLYRSHREMFDAGILPDYWFELKLAAAGSG